MWQYIPTTTNEIYHYGVKGMKWGVIRYLDKLKSRITSRTASTTQTPVKAVAEATKAEKENEKSSTQNPSSAISKAGMLATQAAIDSIKKEKEAQERDEYQKKTEMESNIAEEEINRNIKETYEKLMKSMNNASRDEEGKIDDQEVLKLYSDWNKRKDVGTDTFSKIFKDFYVFKKMDNYDYKKSGSPGTISDENHKSDLVKKYGKETVDTFYKEILPRYKEIPMIKTLLKV